MLLKKLTTALFAIFFTITATAQRDFNQYQLLRSQLPIPEPIRKLASEKAKEELERLKNGQNQTELKNTQLIDFTNISNYEIDKLLKSGKILFNDELTKYVEGVAKRVLAKESGEKDKLNFFLVRSFIPNAFATSSGCIFINIGLIARLKSEEELAFVICHEYVHFKNSHGLLGFENALKLNKSAKKAARKSNYDEDEWLIRDCLFSKEQESEADVEGLNIYLNSVYSKVNPLGALDCLKYAEFPIVGNEKQSLNYLETPEFKIPDSYKLPDSQYNSYSDTLGSEDDQMHTHPNLNSRIAKLESLHKFEYQSSTIEGFNYFKKIAEFESTYWLLAYQNFEQAIAQSNYLLTKYPNNAFLKGIQRQAWFLFGLTIKFRNSSDIKWDSLETLNQGPYSISNYFFKKTGSSKHDAGLIALRLAWIDLQDNPNNAILKKRVESLIYIVTVENKFNPSALDSGILSSKKKSISKSDLTNYYADLKNPEALRKQLLERFNKGEVKKRELTREQLIEQYRDSTKNGFKLGAKNVICFSSFVYSIDYRDNVPVQHLESEKKSLAFTDELNRSAKDLNINLIDFGGIDIPDNNIIKLDEAFWIRLYSMEYDLFMVTNGNYISIFENEIQQIRKKYKSDFVVSSFLVKQTARRSVSDVLLTWLFSSQNVLLIPYAVYVTVIPEKRTDLVVQIIDLNDHKKTREIWYTGNGISTKYVTYNQLYDVLFQIKNK